MSNYAITRIKKLKTISKIKAAGQHNSRIDHAPNADPNGTCKLLVGSDTPEVAFDELMLKKGIKPRKNAVLGVEMLFTFSPEMKGKVELSEWIKEHQKFINNEFPSGSVLSAHLHLDETTPHIQLIISPIIEKKVRGKMKWRLACKDYFGTPEKLRCYQDRYADAMSCFGLKRGIRGSRAFHKTMKTMYGEVEKDMKLVTTELDKLENKLEKPSHFNLQNVFGSMQNVLKKFKKVMNQAAKVPSLEKKNQKLEAETSRLRAIINDVRRSFGNKNIDEIVYVLTDKKAELDAEIEQKYSKENQIIISKKPDAPEDKPKPNKGADLTDEMVF
jgi:hypothetical protein